VVGRHWRGEKGRHYWIARDDNRDGGGWRGREARSGGSGARGSAICGLDLADLASRKERGADLASRNHGWEPVVQGGAGTRAAGAGHAGARFVGSISPISHRARKGEPISRRAAMDGSRRGGGAGHSWGSEAEHAPKNVDAYTTGLSSSRDFV
jgi:hypothetical protein